MKRQSWLNSVHFSITLKQNQLSEMSSDIWKKLEEIYQSKGPVCKDLPLKSLIQHKMPDSSPGFMITYGKSSHMENLRYCGLTLKNGDLLTVMISLLSSYENFWCTIASWDVLQKLEAVLIQIVEENNSCQHDDRQSSNSEPYPMHKQNAL